MLIKRKRYRNNSMKRRLPNSSSATGEPPPEKPARLGGIQLKAQRAALVVDSDQEVAVAIAAALRKCGWHVQPARTIAEARLRLPALRPRIVLLDMWQADGSGIAFVRELAGRADVGIIVVSVCSDLADCVVGLELGADDYVTKPFLLHELTARVRALDRRIGKQVVWRRPAFGQLELTALWSGIE